VRRLTPLLVGRTRNLYNEAITAAVHKHCQYNQSVNQDLKQISRDLTRKIKNSAQSP